MALFDRYRRRLMKRTAPESLAGLSSMQTFFRRGANWTQGEYHANDGRKCLVGAAEHVRASALDHAQVFLKMAVAERGYRSIESFNDSRCSFADIEQVLDRAKQLALSEAQAPAVEILLPPARRALPPPDAVPVVIGAKLLRVKVDRR